MSRFKKAISKKIPYAELMLNKLGTFIKIGSVNFLIWYLDNLKWVQIKSFRKKANILWEISMTMLEDIGNFLKYWFWEGE